MHLWGNEVQNYIWDAFGKMFICIYVILWKIEKPLKMRSAWEYWSTILLNNFEKKEVASAEFLNIMDRFFWSYKIIFCCKLLIMSIWNGWQKYFSKKRVKIFCGREKVCIFASAFRGKGLWVVVGEWSFGGEEVLW